MDSKFAGELHNKMLSELDKLAKHAAEKAPEQEKAKPAGAALELELRAELGAARAELELLRETLEAVNQSINTELDLRRALTRNVLLAVLRCGNVGVIEEFCRDPEAFSG